jgi:hypothetical protein
MQFFKWKLETSTVALPFIQIFISFDILFINSVLPLYTSNNSDQPNVKVGN